MPSFLHFIKYNNALPVIVALALVGTGGAFAATDPGSLYSSSQQVVTVDNTYIADKDLSNWTPTIEITGVTQDADNYYVAYNLSTINIENYVWQDVVEQQTMTVSKTDLADRDLGVYVTAQFKNIIANQLAYLEQVQTEAKQDETQETLATTYGGLIGKMLTNSTQTLPGYTPVVTPPPAPEPTQQTAAAALANPSTGSSIGTDDSSNTSTNNNSTNGGTSASMSLQLLGNDPAQISVGAAYVDLGVVLIDPGAPNLGYQTYVDGVSVPSVSIDTSTSSAHTIEYQATDQSGNTLTVRRIVLVGNAPDPGGEISSAGNIPNSSPTPAASPASSAPAPVTPAPALTTDTPTPTATSTSSDDPGSTGSDSGTATSTVDSDTDSVSTPAATSTDTSADTSTDASSSTPTDASSTDATSGQ